jgi:hypothetical protein
MTNHGLLNILMADAMLISRSAIRIVILLIANKADLT